MGKADVDEIALFKAARFVKDADFGEVRFLKRGEKPEPMGNMEIADWFAQEADGAVIGRLRLDGVREDLRPIVVYDNEGSLHVTGFSLVDHFGSYSLAASQDGLEPLHDFCRKHGLPGPRTSEQIETLARKLKLTAGAIEKGKVPKVTEAALLELRASTPAAAAAAKPVKAAKGKKSSPQGEYVGWAIGPDGQPWVAVPPKSEGKNARSMLHRWTGDGFVEAGEVKGWVSRLASFKGQLVYDGDGAIVLHDGTKETARFPYEDGCTTFFATAQHLLVYSSYGKRVSKLEGDKLVAIGGAVDEDGRGVMLDDTRLLLVYDKKAVVIDASTGKQTKWAKPPIEGAHKLAVAKDKVVIGGYCELAAAAVDSGKWSPVKSTKDNFDDLVALADGDVLGFVNVAFSVPPQTDVYRISPGKLTVKPCGSLAVGRKPAKGFQVGSTLVLVGGTAGVGGKPVAPEIFKLP